MNGISPKMILMAVFSFWLTAFMSSEIGLGPFFPGPIQGLFQLYPGKISENTSSSWYAPMDPETIAASEKIGAESWLYKPDEK